MHYFTARYGYNSIFNQNATQSKGTISNTYHSVGDCSNTVHTEIQLIHTLCCDYIAHME